MAAPKRRRVIPKSRTKKPAAKKPLPRRRVIPKSRTKKPSTPSKARQAPVSMGGDIPDPQPLKPLQPPRGPGTLKGRDSIRGRGPGGIYNPTLQEQFSNLTTDYRAVAEYAQANPSDQYGANKLKDYANRMRDLQNQMKKSSGGRYGFKPSTPSPTPYPTLDDLPVMPYANNMPKPMPRPMTPPQQDMLRKLFSSYNNELNAGRTRALSNKQYNNIFGSIFGRKP